MAVQTSKYLGSFRNVYEAEAEIKRFHKGGILQQIGSAHTRKQADKLLGRAAHTYLVYVTDTEKYIVYA